MITFGHETGIPLQDRPIALGGGYGRAAEAADQRVTRARGQPEAPRDQIPNDRAQQSAKDRRHGDHLWIDHPFADGRWRLRCP